MTALDVYAVAFEEYCARPWVRRLLRAYLAAVEALRGAE